MYRSTPHSVTGLSPAEMLFGQKIRTKLPQLQDYTLDDQKSVIVMPSGKKKGSNPAMCDVGCLVSGLTAL